MTNPAIEAVIREMRRASALETGWQERAQRYIAAMLDNLPRAEMARIIGEIYFTHRVGCRCTDGEDEWYVQSDSNLGGEFIFGPIVDGEQAAHDWLDQHALNAAISVARATLLPSDA